MFALWYVHLLYKEYRTLLDKLRETRPHAIGDEAVVEGTLTNTITDPNSLDTSHASFENSPDLSPGGNLSVPAQARSENDLSGDEPLFQPLATSTPIPRFISMDPVSKIDAHLPDRTSSSDPNRTPSFSELTSDDPMLVIPIPKNIDPQLKDIDNKSKHGAQNVDDKFVEAEKSSSFVFYEPKGKENMADEDDEGRDECDSDIEDEEENSVISSNPISLNPNVTSPTGSSIEIINHELNDEENCS